MSKGRRGDFEEQLRALQQDIGQLSQKLSIPKPEDRLEQTRESSKPPTNIGDSSPGHPKGELVRLKKDIRTITRERDDALYRLDQLKKENEELRKSSGDLMRLKAHCEHLEQDNISLKTSLESSEKLRKQQKELIQLLQSSHSTVDGSNRIQHDMAVPSDISSTASAPASISSTTRWLHDTAVHPPPPADPVYLQGSPRTTGASRKSSTTRGGGKHNASARHTVKGKSTPAPSTKKTKVKTRMGQRKTPNPPHSYHHQYSDFSPNQSALSSQHVMISDNNRSLHSSSSVHSAPGDSSYLYSSPSPNPYLAASPSASAHMSPSLFSASGRPPRPAGTPGMQSHPPRPQSAPMGGASRVRAATPSPARARPGSAASSPAASRSSSSRREGTASSTPLSAGRASRATPSRATGSAAKRVAAPRSTPAGHMTVRQQSVSTGTPLTGRKGNRGSFGRTTW